MASIALTFIVLLIHLGVSKALIGWTVGSFEMQGRRPYQEDRHSVKRSGDMQYFAVFDGHGGSQASSFSVNRLHELVFEWLQHKNEQQYEDMFVSAYRALDEEFLASDNPSGSTALVAFVQGSRLWVSNTGDCRAVISRGGKAQALSSDHKPNRPDELQRIQDAGSYAVDVMGIWRTERTLAMSRAIGDRHLKHVVIPDPEVEIYDLRVVEGEQDGPNDDLIILGSDGLWDVMENQDAVDFIMSNPSLRYDPELAAKALVMLAYHLGSMDNITAMVILLHHKGGPDAVPKAHDEL